MNDYPLDFTPQCPHVAWLTDHLGGWQFGEQDLLLAVANTLDLKSATEIGAGDGTTLPLTIDRLYESLRIVLYEDDYDSREKLRVMYPNAKVFGRYEDQQTFGQLVVVDIDSNDSQVMQQVMKRDRPVVVVCEHMDRCYPIGTSAPSPFPVWALGHELTRSYRIQDTAETLQWMAGNLGYERFGYNRCNSFFVRQDRFADLFR